MRSPPAVSLVALAAVWLLSACSATAPAGSASQPSPRPGAAGAGPASSPRPSGTSGGAPTTDTAWGPSRSELGRASRLVANLDLAGLAGQVIVARYDGTAAPTALVNGLGLGGVLAFEDNVAGTGQIRRVNRAIQVSAARAGRRWPVLVGVDQEGGVVARVKGRATRFPSFLTAGAANRPALTRKAAQASGEELTGLGFTTVFAPVADVTSGPDDPTIGSRSAGSRPRAVARQVNAALEGYLASGIVPVVKHFPGHGSVPADSHVELPVQRKSLAELRRTDLVPFRSAVARGAPAVMIASIDVRAVDPGLPSSLSRKVVTGLLRAGLGFDGLVVTDSLSMAAVTAGFGSAESAVRALRAGADVLLMPPDPRAARDGIVSAVRSGQLPRARLVQAATRQVAVLLHEREAACCAREPGTSRRISYRLSAAAVSVVSGPCRGRLVGPSVRVSGPAAAVAAFDEAASRAGLPTGSGTSVALVGYGGSATNAEVVVSMDTPYVLGRSRAGIAKIALYGDTPGAMRALVDVLLGSARAPGRLPVPVAGVDRAGCEDRRSLRPCWGRKDTCRWR